MLITQTLFRVLREQWIRAKYERNEFMDQDKQPYTSGHKTGYLWKRGKEDAKFQSRLFVLSEDENVLKYYNKQDVSLSLVTLSFTTSS